VGWFFGAFPHSVETLILTPPPSPFLYQDNLFRDGVWALEPPPLLLTSGYVLLKFITTLYPPLGQQS